MLNLAPSNGIELISCQLCYCFPQFEQFQNQGQLSRQSCIQRSLQLLCALLGSGSVLCMPQPRLPLFDGCFINTFDEFSELYS